MNQKNSSKKLSSRIRLELATLHLQIVAILSAIIFVSSFTFEVLVWYSIINSHLTLVLLLEFILGIWAIIELAIVMRNQDRVHFKILQYFLYAQLLMPFMRWIFIDFQPHLDATDWMADQAPQNNWHFLFLIPYSLLFIGIHQAIVSLFTFNEKANAESTEKQMLKTLNALALARDNETGNHIIRTQHYVKMLALRLRRMGHYKKELDDHKIDLLFKVAPLHDIGKVGIPDQILQKSGRLSDEEWVTMKTHTTIGESVLASSEADVSSNDVIQVAIKIAGGHHERWDGSGYPRGLQGAEIPLAARIMSIADIYDALVSERVYKKSWTHREAIQEIIRHKGTYFDPLIVDAFIAEQDQFQEIAEQFKDE